MRIFEEEVRLGIDKKISSMSRKVTLASKVRHLTDASRISDLQHAFAKANSGKSIAEYNDLFFLETVLVSSGMNGNTDLFGVEELWRARHTPVDKPINLGHTPDLICGHMTRAWGLDYSMRNIIPDNTPETELPESMHLACAGVVYKELESEYRGLIQETIVAIEADQMFVSMECRFDDFDYGLFHDPSGEMKIITRNGETAWLSSLLTWFGGSGIWEVEDDDGTTKKYRIGRYLKGITFTGKGFVKNPANPDSIILNKSFKPLAAASVVKPSANSSNRVKAGVLKIGTITIKENQTMSNEIGATELGKLYARDVEATRLEAENRELKAKLDKKEDIYASLKTKADEFELSNKDYKRIIEAERTESAKKDEEMKRVCKEKAELEQQLEAAKKMQDEEKVKCAELQKEVDALKAAQTLASRTATLVKAGIDSKDAEAFAKTWSTVSDEQYATVAKTYIESNSTKAALEEMKKKGSIDAVKALASLSPDKNQIPMAGIIEDKAVKSGSIFASLVKPAAKTGTK